MNSQVTYSIRYTIEVTNITNGKLVDKSIVAGLPISVARSTYKKRKVYLLALQLHSSQQERNTALVRYYLILGADVIIFQGTQGGTMAVVKFTDEIKAELLKRFLDYIEETANPILAEFCYQNDVYPELLHHFANQEGVNGEKEELDRFTWSYALKKRYAKSEAFLLTLLDSQEVKNPAGAIFRLKALHGYRDSEPAPAPTTINVNLTDLAKKEDTELEDLIGGKLSPKPSGKHEKSSAN